jgi:hypothetical protein
MSLPGTRALVAVRSCGADDPILDDAAREVDEAVARYRSAVSRPGMTLDELEAVMLACIPAWTQFQTVVSARAAARRRSIKRLRRVK